MKIYELQYIQKKFATQAIFVKESYLLCVGWRAKIIAAAVRDADIRKVVLGTQGSHRGRALGDILHDFGWLYIRRSSR